MQDKLLKVMMVLLLITFVIVAVLLIPKAIARSDRAEILGDAMGCVCLGHPRDLNSVYFYDCDGEIIMKRVK